MVLVLLVDVKAGTNVSFLDDLHLYVLSLVCKTARNDNVVELDFLVKLKQLVDWALGQNFIESEGVDLKFVDDQSSDFFRSEASAYENGLLFRVNSKIDLSSLPLLLVI